MKNRLFLLCFLFSTPVFAQSSGIPWRNGEVLTANKLQSLDAAKMNVSSLGKRGFAPKLNDNGQITDPVVGSVASAPANAAGDTVSSIADTAKSAQITANGAVQANGGDTSKTVVTPTGDTASHSLSDVAAQATGSVQKTSIGAANGVAPTDANSMMSAAVSGDSSDSPVAKIAAPGDAVYPIVSTRNVAQHFSDIPTLRDFGMQLAPLQGAPDITWLQNYWSSFTGNVPAILPAGTHWPDNAYVPDSGAFTKTGFFQFPIVTAFGTISHRPGYNTNWNYGVPYFGDIVPSLTHDDASFEFSRVDGNFSSAGKDVPVVRVDQIIDTPFEGGSNGNAGNQYALSVNTATTPRMIGGTISTRISSVVTVRYARVF